EGLGHKGLAQWLVESVASVAHDVEFFRYAAHVFEQNASWPKAIAAWERVKKLNPDDEDAHRQINALSASATIERAGLGDALSTRAAKADPAAALAQELDVLKMPQLSPEERWQKEIEDDPTMVGPYLQYADHLRGLSRLDDAEKLLA